MNRILSLKIHHPLHHPSRITLDLSTTTQPTQVAGHLNQYRIDTYLREPQQHENGPINAQKQRSREENRHSATSPRPIGSFTSWTATSSFPRYSSRIPPADGGRARQYRALLPPVHSLTMDAPLPSNHELGQRLSRQTFFTNTAPTSSSSSSSSHSRIGYPGRQDPSPSQPSHFSL